MEWWDNSRRNGNEQLAEIEVLDTESFFLLFNAGFHPFHNFQGSAGMEDGEKDGDRKERSTESASKEEGLDFSQGLIEAIGGNLYHDDGPWQVSTGFDDGSDTLDDGFIGFRDENRLGSALPKDSEGFERESDALHSGWAALFRGVNDPVHVPVKIKGGRIHSHLPTTARSKEVRGNASHVGLGATEGNKSIKSSLKLGGIDALLADNGFEIALADSAGGNISHRLGPSLGFTNKTRFKNAVKSNGGNGEDREHGDDEGCSENGQ
jgi:hypothetical protein